MAELHRKTAVLLFTCLVVGLLFSWSVVAWDYGDASTSGTYTFNRVGVQCTLVLKSDHSFTQELKRDGAVARASGSWRRVGEGGLSFSQSFLPLPGEEVEPDGTSYADINKKFGIFVSLRMRRYHISWYGGESSSGSASYPLGTYAFDEDDVQGRITLNADHSFQQEVARAGRTSRVQGTWTLDGDGNIKFSGGFLKTSGQPLNADESATAEQPHSANLQIAVENVSRAGTPILQKRFFW